MKRVTYREALFWASSLLQSHNPKIAEWLQLHLVNVSRMEWIGRLDQLMPPSDQQVYENWIYKVLEGEPYQYIIGKEDFYGRTFKVNAAVLIPRPETELLVENVLKEARKNFSSDPLHVLDVGTGSGAIAITLALESPKTKVYAVDISAAALQVAKENAAALGANVELLHGNLLDPMIQTGQKIDILVSNPPYIPHADKETLARNVIDFEPHTALFAPEEGLYFYRQMIEQAPFILAEKALIAFEVGIHQADRVVDVIKGIYPQAQCQIKQDYQGIDRMVVAHI